MLTVVISGRLTSRELLFAMCHILVMFQVWIINVCYFYDIKAISQRTNIWCLTLLTTWSMRMESARSWGRFKNLESSKVYWGKESETTIPPHRLAFSSSKWKDLF